MKKMMVIVMMMCVIMNNVAFGATLGEYEQSAILEGTYEVCDKIPSVKGLNTDAWTDMNLFGDQYRIYTYTDNGTEKIVCLKHHVDRKARKEIKKAKAKADK